MELKQDPLSTCLKSHSKSPTAGVEYKALPTAQLDQKSLEEENSTKRSRLADNQDVTQLTNVLSMFVVHIGILRAILENPGTTHYTLQVSLIITALALQIWAGLLSLYIVWLRRYYANNKEDLFSDCGRLCCPCKLERKMNVSNCAEDWINTEPKDKHIDIGCCQWKCRSNPSSHDQEAFDVHKVVRQRLLRVQLKHIKSKDETEELHMLQKQEKVLRGYTDKLQMKFILQRLLILQYLLSTIVFIVSILNAIFTGLGMDEIVEINGTLYKVHKSIAYATNECITLNRSMITSSWNMSYSANMSYSYNMSVDQNNSSIF